MGPIPFISPGGGCLGIAYTSVWVFLLQLRNAEDRVSPRPFPSPRRPLAIRLRQDTASARVRGPGRVWAGLQTSRAHNSIENKFVNIKVKCKCVQCSLNFVEEREEKKTYEYVILLG